MGHLLGERCFGLQWHLLIKHKENVKKGLKNGPKQTAVLRHPSDSGAMVLHDAGVIPGLHQDDAHPRAWPRHRGQAGAQRDRAAFRPLNRGTGMGWQGQRDRERGLPGCPALAVSGAGISGAAGHEKVTVWNKCQRSGLSLGGSGQVVCSHSPALACLYVLLSCLAPVLTSSWQASRAAAAADMGTPLPSAQPRAPRR